MQAIVVLYDQRIAATMPHVKMHTLQGRDVQVVPHRATEVKLLRNLGYDAPAPILTLYKWPGELPYGHQITTAAMLSTTHRGYVLSGLGSGKTRAALFAADFLMQQGEAKKALIIAPLSTLSMTWEREIFSVMPHRKSAVLHGTKSKRLEELDTDVDFYVVNTDGPNVILDALLARADIDIIIIDELAQFRNARTRRWKALNKVAHTRRWVWGMTGLPTPNSPCDAWAQARLITPETVPKYMRQFRDSVEYKVTQFKWAPRDCANDIVHAALAPAVRFATEDCVDLPPTTYSTRTTALGDAQKKAYKELMTLFFTQYMGEEVTAANAGVKASKLLQVACGFLYSETRSVVFPTNPKLQVVREIIDETEQKVLVFAPFTEAVDLVADALEDEYYVGRVYGKTPTKQRNHLFSQFRNDKSFKVLVAHPGVLSHGLTLVEASTIVWYSPVMSYETFAQANARIVRPGQQQHTHIINIESCPIEAHMFRRLAGKGEMSTVLLDMLAEATKQGGIF